jgi:hypothetical protein
MNTPMSMAMAMKTSVTTHIGTPTAAAAAVTSSAASIVMNIDAIDCKILV